MPYKNHFPILPFLDPQFDPNHPANHVPEIVEDPYAPLSDRQRKQLQEEKLEEALLDYQPSHVLRSWETNTFRAERRKEILSFTLPHRPSNLVYRIKDPKFHSVAQPQFDINTESYTDFRRFAERTLHLGYWRFHPSTEPQDDEPPEQPDLPPEEICWIMEYRLTECNTIRRKIANMIGAFPAAMDPTNQLFDEEIEWRYRRRLFVRCHRWNKRCVRPSHIVVSTYNNILLP